MSTLFIQDTTLTAIADAIRSKSGDSTTSTEPLKEIVYSDGYFNEGGGIPANTAMNAVITIPGATKLQLTVTASYPGATGQVGWDAGVKDAPTGFGTLFNCTVRDVNGVTDKAYVLENTDTVTINFWCPYGSTATALHGVYVEVIGFDADGNQIMSGNTATYTPLEMPAAILAISGEGGGGITPEGEIEITVNGDYDVTSFAGAHVAVPVGIFPTGLLNIYDNGLYNIAEYEQVNVLVPTGGTDDIEPIVLTGDQGSAFSGKVAQAFVKAHPDKISTEYLKNVASMFENYSLATVPFSLNWENWGDPATSFPASAYSAQYMFRYAALEELTEMKVACITALSSFCMGATKLREIPEGFAANWYWNNIHQVGRQYAMNYGFQNCNSLTYIDSNLLNNWWCNNNQNYGASYGYLVQNCYNLNELRGLGVSINVEQSAQNLFYYTFMSNWCMKRFTFDTNNGTPIVAKWTNQTIDLSSDFGYYWGGDMSNNFWNSGRTLDDRIYDATSYAANKNKKNAYVACSNYNDAVAWSLYNKTAAEETVRSLPDCSAYGGSNTIKFNRVQGELTDGGAIGLMSEDVIAAAAAKGWTVTFV